MLSSSPPTGMLDFSPLQWPAHRWALLSVRAWVHGMAEGQVPMYSPAPTTETAPEMLDLPEFEGKIPATTKYTLDMQRIALHMERERLAQNADQKWRTDFRPEYYPAWQPVSLAPANTRTSNCEPDPLAILCPSHLVPAMMEVATSFLVLMPGVVTLGTNGEEIQMRPGPCLTIVQGFIRVVAHLPLWQPPSYPLEKSMECQGQMFDEVLSACRFTKANIGVHYWLPTFPDPNQAMIRRY